MGTKMGPSYANLFVRYVEHQFFNQYDGPKPDFYGRYIDDCIGAISSSREELNRFITSVNSFHPALKYTWEISETSLAFLDIKVFYLGKWGKICRNDWDVNDVKVVCRQLGFRSVLAEFIDLNTRNDTISVVMSNVDCTGQESVLASCNRVDGKHNCTDNIGAQALCEPSK